MSLFSFLKSDPTRRLKVEYKKTVEKAYQCQQNGDIRNYSLLTAEAEKIKEEIARVEAAASETL
jgi:hypothetical protein